jgi:hypothetical protein
MKYFMIILISVFILFSCDMNKTQKVIVEKETIIKEKYNLPSTAVVKQIHPGPDSVVSLWKNLSFGSKLFAVLPSKTAEEYFVDGIMYKENSFPIVDGGNGIVHQKDLKSLIQNKASICSFLVEWVSGCQDETFSVYFKPHGMNVEYNVATCRFGQPSKMATVITDTNCVVDWYHDYTWGYEHAGVNKQIQVIVYLVYYSNGVIVQ